MLFLLLLSLSQSRRFPSFLLPVQLECDNFITVIQKVNDTMIVCGTNAGSPRCWMLVRLLLQLLSSFFLYIKARESGQKGSDDHHNPTAACLLRISGLGSDLGALKCLSCPAGQRHGADRRPGRTDRVGLRHLAGVPVSEVHQPPSR